jgi:hypothetical protein
MATEPTEAQIQAFGQKLQAFAATLPPEEQSILETILRLAMGADDAVEGDQVQGYDAVSVQRPQSTATLKMMGEIRTSLANAHEMKKSLIGNFPR